MESRNLKALTLIDFETGESYEILLGAENFNKAYNG